MSAWGDPITSGLYADTQTTQVPAVTDEMLELARNNQRKAGVENVEFLKGEIENIPLPDDSDEVIISNCAINLSANKNRVLKEAFRVLRPGGRLAVSDIVVRGGMPKEIRDKVELWVGCIAGALEEHEYEASWDALGSKISRLNRPACTRAHKLRPVVQYRAWREPHCSRRSW